MQLSFVEEVASLNPFRGEPTMRHCLATICFAALAVSAAFAQERKAVPPPPKPADDAPNLEVTMKFIQEKVNGVGPISYIAYSHDNATGNDMKSQWTYEVTKVVADGSACRITDHFKQQFEEGNAGAVLVDGEFQFLLRDVEDIVVMPMEQVHKEWASRAGHSSLTYSVDPAVFLLRVRRTNTKEVNEFVFVDEQLANRVAKAMVHAVELCGGGSTPEPF